MARIAPARPRSTRTAIPGGLRIVIPARRRWFVTAFLLVWLCGWAFGEAAALWKVVTEAPAIARNFGPSLFLIVWLLGWTVGGVFALTMAAWSVAGREVVSLSGATLAVRREAFGIGRTSEYDSGAVRNVRVAAQPYDPSDFRSGLRFWGLGGGPIAFDYGAATHRFGAGVEEAEAAELVQALRDRLPSAS